MSTFTFSPFNKVEFLENGHSMIGSSIKGFMDDAITVHVHRISLNLGVSVDIKRWHGSHDPSSPISHLDAELIYAQALMSAVELAKSIEAQGKELMREYETLHSPNTIAS